MKNKEHHISTFPLILLSKNKELVALQESNTRMKRMKGVKTPEKLPGTSKVWNWET